MKLGITNEEVMFNYWRIKLVDKLWRQEQIKSPVTARMMQKNLPLSISGGPYKLRLICA